MCITNETGQIKYCLSHKCPQLQIRNKDIISLYNAAGLTLKEISDIYKISQQTCHRIIQNHNIKGGEKRDNRSPGCTFEMAQKIAKLIQTDIEARIIFEHMRRGRLLIEVEEDGVSVGKNHKIRKRNAYNGAHAGRFRTGHKENTPEVVEKIRETKIRLGICKR